MRTRLVMAGAFLGALALLTLSMLFSWPVTVDGAQPGGSSEADFAFDSQTGTCLDWPPDNAREIRRVDCVQPHTFEVTTNVEISAEYGSDAPPPDERRWQEIANERCTDGAVDYLGGKLDPHGKYRVSALKPTDQQWNDGDRKLRCGLHRVTSLGTRLRTTGSAAGQDQSNVHEPGTCFALVDKAPGDPTDCVNQHSYEVVGNVDLGPAFPNEVPDEAKQMDKLAELCAQVAAQYSGGADLAAKRLTLTWDTLRAESWAAGSRKVDCKVGARLPDGSGLAQVTGTIRAVSAAPTTTTGG